MPPHRAYTRNANTHNGNTIPTISDHKAANAEFQNGTQILAQSEAN